LVSVVGLIKKCNHKLGWIRHLWSWWRYAFSKKTIFCSSIYYHFEVYCTFWSL